MNFQSKTVIFVPGCMLCPFFQAVQNEKTLSWPSRIIPFLVEHRIGMIPLPCPEISYGGLAAGATRKSHNIRYYGKRPDFIEHCRLTAQPVVEQITELSQTSFRIIAVSGVEDSPTCAASRMFVHGKGNLKQQGIMIAAISAGLEQQGIVLTSSGANSNKGRLCIPLIGIDRRKPEKFLSGLAL